VKDRGYAPPTIAELERLFAGEYEKFRAQNPDPYHVPRSGGMPGNSPPPTGRWGA
jgi:hypothetical protein